MRDTIILCDKCGEVTDSAGRVEVRFPGVVEELTLCSTCSAELYNHVTAQRDFKNRMRNISFFTVAKHVLEEC
jgi:hypothetical protein